MKHSGSSKINISIELNDSELGLSISDFGNGFDIGKIDDWPLTREHFGLIGMKERFQGIGGELQINSIIHQGTILKASYSEIRREIVMSFNNDKLEKIKVLVVDDHTLFAEGTVSILSSETNLEIVGIANDGNQCLTLLRSKIPDIILLDISLPDCSGINLVDDIKSINPAVKIIMLTGLNPKGYLTKSLQKGVHGFLLKECNKKEMIEAIFFVAQGKEYFSKGLAPLLKLAFVGSNGDKALTSRPIDIGELLSSREEEIMDLIAKGLNNQEISSTLGITIRTVKFHTSNILIKLSVKSRSKAVAVWTEMSMNEVERH